MNMFIRRHYPELAAELERLKASYRVEMGRRHVHLHVDGIDRSIVLPLTPSDWRAGKNAKAVFRRMWRERAP